MTMNYVENECKTSTQCSPTAVKNIKYSYIFVAVLTAIVQTAIPYAVIKTVCLNDSVIHINVPYIYIQLVIPKTGRIYTD